MELREVLTFKNSTRPRIDLEIPTEEGADDSITLILKGVANKQIANALGIGYVFQSDTVAHSGFRDLNLDNDVAFVDVELKLRAESGELDTFYPEKVHSFRAFRTGGGGLGIQCKAEVSGRLHELLDFFRSNRREGFEFAISSRQGELFEGEGGGTGTRVDLSDKPDVPVAEPETAVLEDRSYETRARGGRRKKNAEAAAAGTGEPETFIQ